MAFIGIKGEQELNPDGHTFQTTEAFQFFGYWLPFDFEQPLSFNCPENPTTWSLRLSFRTVFNGKVPCDITIQRSDDAPVHMSTEFWIRPIFPFDLPGITQNIRFDIFFPNDKRTETILFVAEANLTILGIEALQVEMFFQVRNCHSASFVEGLDSFPEVVNREPPAPGKDVSFGNLPIIDYGDVAIDNIAMETLVHVQKMRY